MKDRSSPWTVLRMMAFVVLLAIICLLFRSRTATAAIPATIVYLAGARLARLSRLDEDAERSLSPGDLIARALASLILASGVILGGVLAFFGSLLLCGGIYGYFPIVIAIGLAVLATVTLRRSVWEPSLRPDSTGWFGASPGPSTDDRSTDASGSGIIFLDDNPSGPSGRILP